MMTFSVEADVLTPLEASTRVLHLIESDGVYGAEQVVLALGQQAARDQRFPPVIGCLVKDVRQPNALHERALAMGLPAHKIPLRNSTFLFDVMRLPFTLYRLDVGLIHAHGYKAAIAGYAAHLMGRTPILATCHLWFDEDSQNKWTYRWLTRLERFLYRGFPDVVAVSAPIAARLRESGVPPERVTEIPNGIVLDVPPGDRQALRKHFGVDSGAFVVLNVGRLTEQKAQGDLITAAAQLRAVHPHLHVLILGEGHLRLALEEQIERAGLRDRARLLGFHKNVNEYLAIADAFALPSIDEGLPIALLEALAAGVPVICTPVGELRRLLEDGVSALFVPVHDPDALAAAVNRLIERPALCSELAERGRAVVREKHTADAMYGRYREIYARLVA